jgi:hypothetical protein
LFAVVSFVGQNHLPIDGVELETVSRTPGYLLVSNAGGPTYIYAPDFPNREMAYRGPTDDVGTLARIPISGVMILARDATVNGAGVRARFLTK